MQIHSRKMNTNKDVNFEELARCTDDFNGAQCKAVCIEAVRMSLDTGSIDLSLVLLFLLTGYDCITSRCRRSPTRRLHGCHSGSPSEKEDELELLCLIQSSVRFLFVNSILLGDVVLFSFKLKYRAEKKSLLSSTHTHTHVSFSLTHPSTNDVDS